ncbi:tRNA-dihydrouridine(16/17) synthase [NAD(P)(+)]-like protein [Bulinus truncatus]|nr:tRNA-dihydrouridine(16/17) synthase [NAD(P)(+)]-like protein [Bulinus truncatus]
MSETENETIPFKFWRHTLKSAKYVVAPMVDQSELAWRMLSRHYGAELCYTPMFHASVFVKDANYRKESLQTCPEDRPLIVQFCANDPDTLLKAAKLAEPFCDAIDLNLGCPQVIAKRGHYGAFLQDEWDLLKKMVKTCHENLKVPITCKIRVFPSLEKTVEYAEMLEEAGCQLLTVHGRTREQKGQFTGIADWSFIKAVREAVKIPVFANGNIQYLSDVHRCLQQTGAQGVMSAEGNLHNPAIFHGKNPPIWDITQEYLDFAEKYPCPLSYVRGHVFKICHHGLTIHQEVRDLVANARSVQDFRAAVETLKNLCEDDVKKFESDLELFNTKLKLPLPYWICQPYVRPGPEEELDAEHKEVRQRLNLKRAEDMQKVSAEEPGLSNNKLKKKLKCPNKNFDPVQKLKFETCQLCLNPKGLKCEYGLCKGCCKAKTNMEVLDCAGHNIKKKTNFLKKKMRLAESSAKINSDVVTEVLRDVTPMAVVVLEDIQVKNDLTNSPTKLLDDSNHSHNSTQQTLLINGLLKSDVCDMYVDNH